MNDPRDSTGPDAIARCRDSPLRVRSDVCEASLTLQAAIVSFIVEHGVQRIAEGTAFAWADAFEYWWRQIAMERPGQSMSRTRHRRDGFGAQGTCSIGALNPTK